MVGAFRRLHAKDAVLRNHHRLADVERSGRPQEFQPALDVGKINGTRPVPSQRALRHQDARRNLVRTQNVETSLFEDVDDAVKEVAVAATKDAGEPRQQAQRLEVEAQLPQGRADQSADEHHVPATLLPGKAAHAADLPDGDPMMRVVRDS